ncbi:MAG: hypothetical protein JNJ57_01085, partial [Saprospiraceae bacterium]|nr:hypothetical protein [Saprospiraceae bacterium]
DRGRTADESAVICVLDGQYCGFGFFDHQIAEMTVHQLLEQIRKPQIEDRSVGQIIQHGISANKGIKKVPIPEFNPD